MGGFTDYHGAVVDEKGLADGCSGWISIPVFNDAMLTNSRNYWNVEFIELMGQSQSHMKALAFIESLPKVAAILATDIRAALEGDPATKGPDDVIFCYPGLLATLIFRLAHELYKLDVPVIPRIMTEYAHSKTGIDIHPGATIGQAFFIDHGTGVVIGETTIIGKNVRLYQGVTLGALSLPRDAGEKMRNKKRHPTIEDDVIIYANTTILGGQTIIGKGSTVGGNIWLTESVPPGTKVLLKRPELIYSN